MTYIPSINSVGQLNAIGSGIKLTPPSRISAQDTTATAGLQQTDGPTFKDYLLDSIKQVNSMQQDADRAVETLFTGGDVNPAEVLTAVQKADLAFRTVMQIRNKLVAAYEEIQ